ncbi:MAG: efflux RND transporter periplasmic adaptor subunit [Gammaproteobacteria bacterium]|nr:efflux RND transporter periplasmic adaptor subunit [Gammaproteobacteria bacterium]
MARTLKVFLPILFIVLAIGGSFVMVQSRPAAMQKPVSLPALLVAVNTAARIPVTFMVRSQGSVSPRTETTLMSEVSGQIIDVSSAFVSGGFFKRGDILVRIDPRNYQSAVKRAKAGVAKAQTQVATESALSGYAYEDWQRLREFDQVTREASSLALRKPQLQAALAELESKEADLEMAQEDLNRTVIRAPYNGMVREKIADVGQFVNISGQLARTFAVDRAEVRLPLAQQDLQFLDITSLAAGARLPVTLTADIGGQTFTWSAQIVRSEGVFDATSRMLYVVAQIEDPYDLEGTGREPLRMGTFVTAEISGNAGGQLFAIPRHALSRGKTLWLVDDQLRIQPSDVHIVRMDEKFAYVDKGLEEGDRYAITPIDRPLPGMKVRFGESSRQLPDL